MFFVLFSCTEENIALELIPPSLGNLTPIEYFTSEFSAITKQPEFKSLLVNNLKLNAYDNHSILVRDLGELIYTEKGQLLAVKELFNQNALEKLGTTSAFEDLLRSYPNLEVSLIDKWNLLELDSIEHQIPVAYSVNEIHKSLGGVYPTYDIDGNYKEIPSNILPPNLHLYIGQSDLYKVIDKKSVSYNDIQSSDCFKSLTAVHETESYVMLEIEDFDRARECAETSAITQHFGAKSVVSTICPSAHRDYNPFRDHLKSFEFHDKDDIDDAFYEEGAFDNRLEMMCTIIIFDTQTNIPFTITKPKRGLRKGDLREKRLWGRYRFKTVHMNSDIIHWVVNSHGCSMTYQWTEEDGGGSSTLTVPLTIGVLDPSNPGEIINSTVIFQQVVESEDDDMGRSVVDYCNSAWDDGTEYNTGPLLYRVNLQQ